MSNLHMFCPNFIDTEVGEIETRSISDAEIETFLHESHWVHPKGGRIELWRQNRSEREFRAFFRHSWRNVNKMLASEFAVHIPGDASSGKYRSHAPMKVGDIALSFKPKDGVDLKQNLELSDFDISFHERVS